MVDYNFDDNSAGRWRTSADGRSSIRLIDAGFRTQANDGEPQSQQIVALEKVAGSSPVGHPPRYRIGKVEVYDVLGAKHRRVASSLRWKGSGTAL